MPRLKNVSYVFVFAIIIPAVSAEDALHYAADSLRLAFEQQVNVVRHQAERVDEEWRAGFLPGDECEKPKSILVSMENILPVISAGNNMIKATLNLDPKLPRHMCEMITGTNEYRRIADPTPGAFAVTGSVMQSNSSGEVPPYDVGRVELGALGTVVPTQEPDGLEPHSFSKGGQLGNPEKGCQFNYSPMDCGKLKNFLGALGVLFAGNHLIAETYRPRHVFSNPPGVDGEGGSSGDGIGDGGTIGDGTWVDTSTSSVNYITNTVTINVSGFWELSIPAFADNRIRLTNAEIHILKTKIRAEVKNNSTCAKFVELLASRTLGRAVDAWNVLNEAIDRARYSTGIYWAAYPGAGGAAHFYKENRPQRNIAEIWYTNRKDSLGAIAGLIHEVLHVAARADDIELSEMVRDSGITPITDHGRILGYPTDPDNRNRRYSEYWGQALKNHCGPGTILGGL